MNTNRGEIVKSDEMVKSVTEGRLTCVLDIDGAGLPPPYRVTVTTYYSIREQAERAMQRAKVAAA